jgi:transcriptional regulator with XRE-family HTH domain
MSRIPIIEAELRQRVAALVRAKRTATFLTVKQAAQRAGMHCRHWQKIEAAQTNVSLATLARVAAALDVEPSGAPPGC